MILRIIAVGRLREKYWQDAAGDFIRRLRPYARLEMAEVSEAHIKETASSAEGKKAMQEEALAILYKLKRHCGPVIVLDRKGKDLDSPEMSAWLHKMILEGKSEAAFVIGGPLGLAPEVLERADLLLSFSKMTFPHQMMRVILLEQIYRSFRIMHGEPYHK
ncbi:MAG TPA: 23S rRNA (pseudouridine(1915)-N(3))-methyltransferase RlmH [Methanothrix sp.]|nr:23S rRNA (pseudouridine(1915)-N(3))-methyltransferase RlmH [Methanothrix sp.]